MRKQMFEEVIQLEKKFLSQKERQNCLADLLDDEFFELGSSAKPFTKHEVLNDKAFIKQPDIIGKEFKATWLTADIILLNYLTTHPINDSALSKQMVRTSIWRKRNSRWLLVFHQGTIVINR